MPGEKPFFVKGYVASLMPGMALIKVQNGNVYEVFPHTVNLEFDKLTRNCIVECEVTTRLTRVLSAKIYSSVEQPGSSLGS